MKNCDISIKKEMGQRFKLFRENIGFRQHELASILNMGQSSITSIEKGKSLPTIPIILYLMKNYHLSPLWLMTEEGGMFIKENSIQDFISEDLIECFELVEAIPEIKQSLLVRLNEIKEIFKDKILEYEKVKKKSFGDTDIDTSEDKTG